MNGFARILYIKICNIPSLKKVVCFGQLSSISLVKSHNTTLYPNFMKNQYGRHYGQSRILLPEQHVCSGTNRTVRIHLHKESFLKLN